MNKMAPNITRQRLLIEGYFTINVDQMTIEEYFQKVTKHLDLRIYATPIIYSPEGMGKGENQGYDAFVPLIDSGISLYVWTVEEFLSLIIYTCKIFENERAIEFTKSFFKMTHQLESKIF